MNTWVEAPPRKGLGCFARGCLILLVFGIVLAVACLAGMYWGFQKHSAIVRGIYWLAKTHSVGEAPVTIPEFSGSDAQIQNVRQRWLEFEQKTRAGQAAQIELTADDINALIASEPATRRKVFVTMEGNQLRLQASVPFGELLGRPGYYFNGEVTIEFKGAESLDSPQLNQLVVNGQQVPRDVLNWKYRSKRLRDYLADFRNTHDIGTIELRDGKMILRSGTD